MTNEQSLLYSKDHEWLRFNDDKNIVTIGITDFAQNALGDIVFVELPQMDSEVKLNSVVGTVESVKSVSDIFSPISGKVIEVNKELEDKPELLNQEPYDGGWIYKVQVGEVDTSHLMNLEEYKKTTV